LKRRYQRILDVEPLHIFNALPLRYLSATEITPNRSAIRPTRLRKGLH